MSIKTNKIIHWVITGLFSAMMIMSAGMYVFNHEELSVSCESIGFPAWILYPLAAAKVLGIVAILTKKSAVLKEWAYAGFLFTLLLAIAGHSIANDGNAGAPAMALALLAASYITDRKIGKEIA